MILKSYILSKKKVWQLFNGNYIHSGDSGPVLTWWNEVKQNDSG